MDQLNQLTSEFVNKYKYQIKNSIYGECINNIINLAEREQNNCVSEYVKEMYSVLFPHIPEQCGYTHIDNFYPIWNYFYEVLNVIDKEYKLSHEWVIKHAIFLLHYVWNSKHSFEDEVPFPMDYSDDDKYYLYATKRKDKLEWDFQFKLKNLLTV